LAHFRTPTTIRSSRYVAPLTERARHQEDPALLLDETPIFTYFYDFLTATKRCGRRRADGGGHPSSDRQPHRRWSHKGNTVLGDIIAADRWAKARCLNLEPAEAMIAF
jgi:hypothetical protein